MSSVSEGTRIRFGEGRSVTVIEPIAEARPAEQGVRHRDDARGLTSAFAVAGRARYAGAQARPASRRNHMTIKLSDHEKGDKFDGDYSDALAVGSKAPRPCPYSPYRPQSPRRHHVRRLGRRQKGGIIRRLTAEWDPRYYEVWPIRRAYAGGKNRHFLWRFWQKLPACQDISVFDRSWYGRVL